MTIGQRISELLEQKYITRRELAEAVGCTEVTISRIIKDERSCEDLLPNIAKVLDASPEYIVRGAENDSNVVEEEYNKVVSIINRIRPKMTEKQRYALIDTLIEECV